MSSRYSPHYYGDWEPVNEADRKRFYSNSDYCEADLNFGQIHIRVELNKDNTFTAYIVGHYWENYTERRIKAGKHRRSRQALLRKLVRRLEAGASYREALRSL